MHDIFFLREKLVPNLFKTNQVREKEEVVLVPYFGNSKLN